MRLKHNVDILTRQMEDAQAAAKTTVLQTLIQTALLPDEQALSVAAYYKDWKVGESYLCGDCVNHFGKLYRAIRDTTAEQGNSPDIDKETWREVVNGEETSGNNTLEG